LEKHYIDGSMLKKMFMHAANTLDKNKSTVDALNVFPVPDGDTGTNMALTMASAVEELEKTNSEIIGEVAQAIATGSLMGARGNSGVILSQLFRGFAKRLKDQTRLDTRLFAAALTKGVETAYKAVMKPTEGTILTVARETAQKAEDICDKDKDFDIFLEQILKQSNITLEKTPGMLKVLEQAGVVDAGGKGFVYILLGFLKAFRGEEIQLNIYSCSVVVEREDIGDQQDLVYPYCTQFIIKFPSGTVDDLKKAILPLGDSTLVVGDEKVIKVHIHTDKPNRVLEEGLKLGELSRIEIDNMKEQHREAEHIVADEEEKEFGIISVAMGEGFEHLFKDLGVDVVIQGGQTMNPSTQDILNAIDDLDARSIFILPNNGNIIMAANQAKELSRKKVFVIPSKTMPQGISAMIAFNGMQEDVDNNKNMAEAIKEVKTGQVTYAVRDSVFDNIEISQGDIMGISEGHIYNKGNSIRDVAFELVTSLLDEESEVLTIFYGAEIKEEDAKLLAGSLEEELGDCEIEVHYGGQPVYYYIFAVE